MEAIGLLVTLEARPGKEAEAEASLKSAQPLAQDEQETLKWYAIKLGPGRLGIFDTFQKEAGPNAHLNGEIAKALEHEPANCWRFPRRLKKWKFLQAHLKAKCEALTTRKVFVTRNRQIRRRNDHEGETNANLTNIPS